MDCRFYSASSPSASSEFYSDRFIPSRASSNYQDGLEGIDENCKGPLASKDENTQAYAQLLRTELLGTPEMKQDRGAVTPSRNLFRFKSSPIYRSNDAFSLSPVTFQHAELLDSSRKIPRKISKVPLRFLTPQVCRMIFISISWTGVYQIL